MSSLVKKLVLNAGAVALLAGSSFVVNAEKMNLNQIIAYHVDHRVAEVQYYLNADLEQSIYAEAFADVNNQMGTNGQRAVVKMSTVKQFEQDEE